MSIALSCRPRTLYNLVFHVFTRHRPIPAQDTPCTHDTHLTRIRYDESFHMFYCLHVWPRDDGTVFSRGAARHTPHPRAPTEEAPSRCRPCPGEAFAWACLASRKAVAEHLSGGEVLDRFVFMNSRPTRKRPRGPMQPFSGLSAGRRVGLQQLVPRRTIGA